MVLVNTMAQYQTLQKTQIISTDTCSFILDTASVIPESLILINTETSLPVPDSCYQFYFEGSLLVFDSTLCYHPITILIYYTTTAYNLSLSFSLIDSLDNRQIIDSSSLNKIEPLHAFIPKTSDGLIRTGNISRGISVGNTQGTSLQSSLDIRLSGKLNDDVEITAVITDNNIPVQPDGNTRQLQEFDKVFIELKKGQTKLRAGDIELLKPDSYFMNYYKKTHGAVFSSTIDTENSLISADSCSQTIQVSAGVSKGKFARNTFTGIDGNQGPYKLTGADNEQYIIVLSGTEKVYIDGEPMIRGQSEDYIIDYNVGELTFTAKRFITSDSRIMIEFEYSDKNYIRSLITGSYVYSDEKLNFSFHIYSEQDARNQPLQQDLDDSDRLILQQAGDIPMNAVVPGWDSVAFSNDYILYSLIDSLGYDSVFVFSNNPDSANFRVNFSYAGPGNGDYILDENLANGRVYKWVAPVGGIHQGDHMPYIVLVAPKKQQMASMGVEYYVSDNLTGGIEMAVSNDDLNTFSTLGENDNTGSAAKIYIRHSTASMTDAKRKKFLLTNEISYEFTEASFSPIERFRDIEFSRNWNMTDLTALSNDHIVSGSVSLYEGTKQIASFRSEFFNKSSVFSANKNSLYLGYSGSRFRINHNISYVNSRGSNTTSGFFRQKGQFAMLFKPIAIGCAVDQEINLWKSKQDSLLEVSYEYFEFEPFLETISDSSKIASRIWYKKRISKGFQENTLKPKLLSEEAGIRFSSLMVRQKISLIAAYRSTSSLDTLGNVSGNDRNFLSRFEHSINLFKNGISSFLFYEVGSGFESKKEFSYIEVAQGQGQYTWNDYNQNGIRELDEFETARYQDEANYIRIMIPGTEFIQVYTLQLNETFIIEPSRFLTKDSLFLYKVFSRFSNRFQYSINRKTRSDDFSDRFYPIMYDVSDTSLITVYSGLNNTVFFNRAHPVFSVRYRYSNYSNKALLINGFESRQMKNNEIQILWNITKIMGADVLISQGAKINSTEFSLNRNYNISTQQINVAYHIQPDSKHRYSMLFRYKNSINNDSFNAEHSTIISAGPEFRFPLFDKHTITVRMSYHDVKYNADENTSLAFEMLESLGLGSNFTWNVAMQYLITKSIQLNFIIDGRKTNDNKVVHFGSIQIRALL